MSKKVFSPSDKEKAVKMMAEGKLTLKQIADKFGCSVPALILWRKNSRSTAAVQEEWEDEEEGAATPSAAPSDTAAADRSGAEWQEQRRSMTQRRFCD